jgi:hypothetical protein
MAIQWWYRSANDSTESGLVEEAAWLLSGEADRWSAERRAWAEAKVSEDKGEDPKP